MRFSRVSRLSALVVLVCASNPALHAGEALWPIQNLPGEQIQHDWNFTPDEHWARHIQHACVRVTLKGLPAGGSGTFVSANGLVITNRHCVLEGLAANSTAKGNLIQDGMYAATSAEELDCPLNIQVLDQVLDITSQVRHDLGDSPTTAALGRLQRTVQAKNPPGTQMELQPVFGGYRYELYVYKTLDAKLVFVPDAGLGNFGGEDDNFCYPRHALDIAFLRAYQNGVPARTADWLPLSRDGARDGEPVFVAGYPGETERYLPVARMEYLREVELPLKVSLAKGVIRALHEYALSGNDAKMKAQLALERWDNSLKLDEGVLAYLQNPEVMEARKKQERQWRKDLAALKNGGVYLEAFDNIETACRDMRQVAVWSALGYVNSPLLSLAQSLNHFSQAARGKSEAQIAPMAQSFTEFVEHMLEAEGPVYLDVQKPVLTAWITTLREHLGPDSPAVKALLGGYATPAEAAAHLLEKAELLTNKDSVAGLLAKGAAGIDEAGIPLLEATKRFAEFADEHKEQSRAAEALYRDASALLARGLAEAYGAKLPPDASGTLRLGWGKVCGYTEAGTTVPWGTTFSSMLARAKDKGDKPPFEPGRNFRAAQASLDLSTVLDFVSTADGAPGSSGAAVFTREGELAGVLFDGNQHQVASVYAYVAPELGGRSIAVNSAAIRAALTKVYKANRLVEELQSASEASGN